MESEGNFVMEEEELAFEMAPAYDLTNARPNPYLSRFAAEEADDRKRPVAHGKYLVELAPDVLEKFPDSDAVNAALRDYLKIREAA